MSIQIGHKIEIDLCDNFKILLLIYGIGKNELRELIKNNNRARMRDHNILLGLLSMG